MSPDENVAEEQADEQIEEEQNPISSKIDWCDELISAKITPDDEDERDMIEDELWKIIIDDLNQILTSTEYPHNSLNEPIEYPSEDWDTNASKFREAFEYQCTQAVLEKIVWPLSE